MKNRPRVILASLAVTSVFLCWPNLSARSEPDLAAAEAAVRKADAERAAAASTASVDAWMAFYAADAIVRLPHEQLASGMELVRSGVSHLLALPHLAVAWHPVKVEMAGSGDLAYLAGAYELGFGDARGAPLSDRGRVLEIWRKQGDGTWKCIVDIWNSDEAGAAASHAAPQPSAPAAVPASEPRAANVTGEPTPTPAQVADAKYGDVPIRYEETIRQYFQKHLKDPGTVQYQEITKPEKGYTKAVTGNVLMREARDYGWTVRATINAKNSQGRYVGFKTYTFLFRGEKIFHTLSPMPSDEIN
jgi:ketosteroid isomerase-like protein